mmetsp:Transcript_12961/g.21584  ORF Transcript_12961/g.21584 Transcript_12961/m.21584 type:complete len:92 (+) Transcript_12961:134-409(+)
MNEPSAFLGWQVEEDVDELARPMILSDLPWNHFVRSLTHSFTHSTGITPFVHLLVQFARIVQTNSSFFLPGLPFGSLQSLVHSFFHWRGSE